MPRKQQQITAFVCSHTDYSDTSRIFGLYTRELGKIHALGRGVKKKKGELARLELLGQISVQINEPVGESRLYTISSNTELKNDFSGLRTNMKAFAAATYASELVLSLVPFEEPDEEIYDFFHVFLQFIATTPNKLRTVLFLFELRMLRHCGFDIEPTKQDTKQLGAVLDFLSSAGFEAASKLTLSTQQEDKIEEIIRSTLDFHLEKTLKSFSFMKETLCKQKK